MNYRFKNLLGAPYRGGNALLVNNSLLISAVGNRISMVDLVKSESSTLPCETSKNITRIAVTPDGKLLLAVDEENRCYLINVHCRVILHRMSFKSKAGARKEAVRALQFSPDGSLFAVSIGKLVQVWRTPGFKKEFVPFELLRTLTGFNDSVTCLDWSPDGKWIIAGSKDLTARIFNLETKQARPFSLLGHRYVIVSVFFKISKNKRNVEGAYTVSKDGALFDWKFEPREDFGGGEVNADKQGRKRKLEDQDGMEEELIAPEADSEYKIQNGHSEMDIERADAAGIPKEGAPNKAGRKPWMQLFKGTWELTEKRFFMQSAQLTTCDYHRELDLVVVGFGNGIFGLYQMPDFKCIHLLSVTRSKLTTAVFNALGNWLAFGCATLGQMLVWEWRSETYILKQQGHYFDVNCLDYSPDSQMLATGADDNKVKVWNVSSGFCFVTFTEHTNAVTAVHFLPGNHALLSASLDGTVRAWDLLRYRNFRTFTTPSPKQFVSLTSDQSGEVICAGTLDSYEIYVWSMKTGRLLDVLSGHEGPVHGLAFSPTSAVLASSSWDKTVRLWDVFDSKGAVEKFSHSHDVLTVVYRPDGKQLACSTLDGQIQFWNPLEGNFMYVIEGRRDIAGGRLISDRRTAANSSSGKCFTSLCYSADGSFILAAGRSKYICMYSIEEQVLLRRFQITNNLSLDGILDFLNSKQMTDAGPIGLIDDQDSDVEDGLFQQTRSVKGSNLPGVAANHGRPVVSTKCLRISPTGRSWAAATTEGVLMYSLDDDFMFDPTDLDIDVTPEALETALNEKQHLRALLLALRLNEDALIRKCIVSVHSKDIQTVAAAIPSRYLRRVIEAFAECLEGSPHLEFILQWSLELCKVHGHYIQQHSKDFLPALRSLQKALTRLHEDLADTCSSNEYLLKYLCTPLKGIEHE